MLFAPLFGAEGEIEEYLWRPDYVWMRGKIGEVSLEEKVGYVGEDLILLDMRFGGEGEIVFKINPAREAEWKFEKREDGIIFNVSADISSLTGKKAHKLDEELVLICKGDFRLEEGKICVHAREGERFLLAFGIGEKITALEEALENPEQAFERAGEFVKDWMEEIDALEVDENRLRMLYWCWYQFFFNTERPKGLWTKPIICPSMSQYGRGVWLWDSAFHILGLLAGGEKALDLAKSQVYVLVENLIDGHLPREVWVDEPNPQLQAPGILSWASLEIYKRTGEREFIEHIYPALVKNHNWFLENTDSNKNGLYEWEGADSGWDTSPRWDGGAVDAVDLNAWLYLDKLCLGQKILG